MQVGKFFKNIKRAGQNRRAGGKNFLKNIKRAGQNRRAGGKKFWKINKRAGGKFILLNKIVSSF